MLKPTGGLSMHKATPKPRGRLIDTIELATKLNCHPMSIPRFVKTKKGFPQPTKPFGKNLWDEWEIDAYLAKVCRAN
jgi:predicted DNA-binding transcriptional regulator AlpA